ncbi:elongin BC and Polycomb repressive complex 2-associated protein-like [Choloepus didactylus]|uniref:elongin BC and Polycomb repressive complex 2-associated protein-like n=1 Tax=Choloepus didactylus TaxID=27675 RepID=UPI00189EE8C2|nr:elongin BC and Polycomb repressive complex 2-associated protein-like [Choloepus didactylus]
MATRLPSLQLAGQVGWHSRGILEQDPVVAVPAPARSVWAPPPGSLAKASHPTPIQDSCRGGLSPVAFLLLLTGCLAVTPWPKAEGICQAGDGSHGARPACPAVQERHIVLLIERRVGEALASGGDTSQELCKEAWQRLLQGRAGGTRIYYAPSMAGCLGASGPQLSSQTPQQVLGTPGTEEETKAPERPPPLPMRKAQRGAQPRPSDPRDPLHSPQLQPPQPTVGAGRIPDGGTPHPIPTLPGAPQLLGLQIPADSLDSTPPPAILAAKLHHRDRLLPLQRHSRRGPCPAFGGRSREGEHPGRGSHLSDRASREWEASGARGLRPAHRETRPPPRCTSPGASGLPSPPEALPSRRRPRPWAGRLHVSVCAMSPPLPSAHTGEHAPTLSTRPSGATSSRKPTRKSGGAAPPLAPTRTALGRGKGDGEEDEATPERNQPAASASGLLARSKASSMKIMFQ